MTTLVMGAAGAAIGFWVGGPAGAKWGWALGVAAGGVLFPPKGPDGPRLEDRAVTVSTYGIPIPRVYGTYRVSGNVIWSTELQESAEQQGGKGSPPRSTTYSYSASFAVSLCRGPILGVRRIWADGNLIFDQSDINTEQPQDFEAESMVVYQGTEDQMPDPTMQSALGDVPAYRGQAYVVFTDMQLARYGNRIPTLSFEVVTAGAFEERGIRSIFSAAGQENRITEIDPETGYVWGLGVVANNRIVVTDPRTGARLATIPGPPVGQDWKSLVYIPPRRVFWAISSFTIPTALIYEFSADSFSLLRTFSGPALALGAGVWNPLRGHVVLGRQINDFGRCFVYDVNGDSTGLSFDYGVYMGTSGVIVQESVIYITNGAEIILVDALSYALVFRATLGYIVQVNSDRRVTYDSRRRRILITSTGANNCPFTVINMGTMTVSTGTYTLPPGASAVQAWTYHEPSDLVLVGALFNPNQLVAYDAETLTLQRALDNPLSGVSNIFGLVADPDYPDRLYGHTGTHTFQVSIDRALNPAGVSLPYVVTQESLLVGLSPEDIDVSDLAGKVVDGYMIGTGGTVRSNIEQLMMAYYFDAVESGGRVKFVSRGGPSAAVIDLEDLAAHQPGADVPTPVPITRAEEVEMPQAVTVRYANPNADYQVGAQMARRLIGMARAEQIAELPLVLSDDRARQVAEAALYSAWAARTSWTFATTLKHSRLEPTDVVTVGGNRLRITNRTENGGLVDFQGVYESGEVYAQDILGAPASTPIQSIPSRTRTALYLLDLPPLRDQDNDAAFYVAANGYRPGWAGAVVFKSADGGATFDEFLMIPSEVTQGTSADALGDWPENTFDEVNSVRIWLRSGTLSSTSELGVLNGFNAALLGEEILQFRRATLNDDGSYTLRGLLRGRKRSRTAGHAPGDRFILLQAGALRRTAAIESEIGQERQYRGVSIGQTLSSAATIPFTNAARSLRPLAPSHLGGGRSSGGDVQINWTRSARLFSAWRNFSAVPLDEATESYQVDVFADNTFGTIIRTLSSTDPTVTYTSAQQTADFGGNQATVHVRVHQMSGVVGRGDPLQGSV
jgi:hypothetical protein